MSTPLRLALFAVALALIGGAAALVGRAAGGPGGTEPAAAAGMHMESVDPARTNGLATHAAGFSFEPERTQLRTGPNDFRLRILDESGAPTHDFDVDGGVRLHLIVVRRDFSGYQHVHPRLRADGSWSVPLTFARPGVYRAYADFEANGEKTVVGHDLFVAGSARSVETTSASPYTVRLDRSKPGTFAFAVTRNNAPAELQDYVGMRAHLVALHEGDLAYTHVHPLGTAQPGRVAFELPLDPGSYRLFLQFKVNGRVHTAPFAVAVRR